MTMLITVISPRIRPRRDRYSKLMSRYVLMGSMPVLMERACLLFFFVMVIQTVLTAVMKGGATLRTIPMLLLSVITLTVRCPIVFALWTVRLCLVGWIPKTPHNLFTSLLTTL